VCVYVFKGSDYPIWKRHSIFLSFFCSRSAQMGVSLDISFRVTDKSHRIGVSNHMTKYHPTAFEHPSFDTCFTVSLTQCTARLAKQLKYCTYVKVQAGYFSTARHLLRPLC
jgi:hypothetical protein